uniref:Wzy n=1 Tax=Proteus mirabilis TaxID=584 RepID=A0A385JMU9_PROMI|nr:wzy [Proteus mirabilis]
MYYSTLFFYITIYILCILINFLLKSNKKLSVFYLSLFLATAFGLRDYVGNDYEQYVNIYNHINIFNDYDKIELGYFYLNKLSYYIFGEQGYYFLFFICSFLTYYFIFSIAYQNNILTTSISLLFFSGFVFFSNNAIRQALVISIFIYNLKNLEKNHYKYLIITILSSTLIHFSALLFLILFLFPKKKNIPTIFLCILIPFIFTLYQFDIVNLIIKKIIIYIPKYGELYYNRVIEFESKEKGSGLVIIFYYMLLIYLIYNRNKIKTQYSNIFIIGYILFLLAPQVEMWERIMIPFYYTNILFIPLIIKNIKKKHSPNKILGYVFIILLSFLFIYQTIENKNKNGISPFNHLFLKQVGIVLE